MVAQFKAFREARERSAKVRNVGATGATNPAYAQPGTCTAEAIDPQKCLVLTELKKTVIEGDIGRWLSKNLDRAPESMKRSSRSISVSISRSA